MENTCQKIKMLVWEKGENSATEVATNLHLGKDE